MGFSFSGRRAVPAACGVRANRLPFGRAMLGLLLCTALLAGCDRHATASGSSGGATPTAAVKQDISLLRQGRFAHYWKRALPPALYAQWRADWTREAAAGGLFLPAERARYDLAMAQLLAPHAAGRLSADLLPRLAEVQNRYGDQLPIIVGVARSLIDQHIVCAAGLTETQKQQAQQVISALGPRASRAPWFDPDRARRAVAVAVATAQALKLPRLERLRGLGFDPVMDRYGTAFRGLMHRCWRCTGFRSTKPWGRPG